LSAGRREPRIGLRKLREFPSVACPDGTTAASTDTYAFDDVSLTGTHTNIHGDICGLQPAMTKTPFTLAFQGPLASPVDRYPLDCNEIGQCR